MRKMMALLLALVLALAAIGTAAADDLATMVEGTWDLTDIKGVPGADEDQMSAAMEMIKALGGTITMTFHNGTVTLAMSFMGQNETEDSEYSISGNQLVLSGTALDCIISGNQMTLTDGSVTMVLTRSGSAPQTAPADSNSLIGSWKVIENVAQEGTEGTVSYNIKDYFDAGSTFVMIFKDNGMVSLAIEGEDNPSNDEAAYVVDGNQLTIGGIQNFTYSFDTVDGKIVLVLVQGENKMVLEYMGTPDDDGPRAPAPAAGGIEGSWQITAVEGSEDFDTILQLGGTLTMKFENGVVYMIVEAFGMSDTQEMGSYTDDGSTISVAGNTLTYTIEGNTLTIVEDGVAMTLVRK